MTDSPLLVPVQLQAFVLNPAVCNTADDNNSRVIPITQPNYTFLRLDNFLIQNDVLRHADLHNSAPASLNTRMSDLGVNPAVPRRNRHGVYLHWTVPRTYRVGIASADSASAKRHQEHRRKRGLPPQDPDETPVKSNTPDVKPPEAQPSFKKYEAWVVESDYLWKLDDIPTEVDLEVDVSPFVVGQAGSDVDIVEQAEVFIGRRTRLQDWKDDAPHDMADITLLRSSNQLFADFQLHNANVFSILDNFQYGTTAQPQYLDSAQASYYLLGWHRTDDLDPLWDSHQEFSHQDRLNALFMALSRAGDQGAIDDWLNAKDAVRLICHGAMYQVKWDHNQKPAHVPADDFAQRLGQQEAPTISVGTTPMDAMLSYCTARKGTGEDPPSIAKLEEDLLAIDSLLHARDDGVEGQREAKDTVYNWNFKRSPGGRHYFIADDGNGRPTQPTPEGVEALKTVNEYQLLLDACSRTCQQHQWDMFSCWWKYQSDVSKRDDPDTNQKFREQTKAIAQQIADLQRRGSELQKAIDNKLGEAPLVHAKSSTLPFFYQARDPTVLVGGIDSGWPTDYLDDIAVRLAAQVVESDSLPSDLTALSSLVQKALPPQLMSAGASLLSEFFALRPGGGASGDPPAGKSYPQFHDTKDDGRWRDQWGDRQPWFPLYAEWEVEYTHVPFQYWALDEQTARLSDNKQVRYGVEVPSGNPLYEELGDPSTHDTRILSGRVLILPQPSFSLKAKVNQLFQDTAPEILDKFLPAEERKNLLDHIGELSYLSSPLTGLTDGLLTLAQGTHIKPENKTVDAQGERTNPVHAAEVVDAGFTAQNISLIEGNSALTPFASLINFPPSSYCPFKPVSHGQFRFRKFNIIDKFGQALCAVDPQPRLTGPPPLYPCISDFYEPQVVAGTNNANTVIKDEDGKCEFIQIPPQVNQNSRFNAAFVHRTADDSPAGSAYWRPVTEWENPIWGWLVINYADYGIQLFLPDGTFYREVRVGGPNGALAEPKWMPFAPDQSVPGPDTAQLDALIDRLVQPDYLRGFWYMVSQALDSLQSAPDAYGQFLSSIVGRPLALVNMGWSLELDRPPLTNQSTVTVGVPSVPDVWLLDPGPEAPHRDMVYQFRAKLGDKDREYDGLVGYFDAKPQPGPGDKGHELILDNIYTYFAPKTPMNPLKPLTRENYPAFKPYWVPPTAASPVSPQDYTDRRNQQLQVYGAILDPFTPVHMYSSFLPAQPLQLAPWTWQDAMNRMTAFFHAGPLTLTADVKPYDASRKLTTQNMKNVPPDNLALPALATGDWNWLQPYVDNGGAEAFNSYGIERKVEKSHYERQSIGLAFT
ncbi:hypothetical protein EYZ11_008792 [Aspergillus tanneri]|uniref:Uncharacterized protein n=1 Tax=Aspergillus tanneri TaxID=1220188 RepID=A0A4S3JF17_9EURO|nr:hypothetical protein EYZ11_008792 [Aspergillus tanneri]